MKQNVQFKSRGALGPSEVRMHLRAQHHLKHQNQFFINLLKEEPCLLTKNFQNKVSVK